MTIRELIKELLEIKDTLLDTDVNIEVNHRISPAMGIATPGNLYDYLLIYDK